MSALSIEEYNRNIQVVFHGYQPTHTHIWCCYDCFEKEYEKITIENEHYFLTRSYIRLVHLSDNFYTDRSNYCSECLVPLYDIAPETCLHSSPTSRKWLNRFKQKRRYGLQGGGI